MAKKRFENLKQVTEALIFASDTPIPLEQIKGYVEETTVSQIRKVIDELNLEYKKNNRAFHIIHVAGGVQMVTREAYSQWVKKIYQRKIKSRLTQAALETLSVIAFRQPVSKTEAATIRGVNCDGVVKTLLERKLITICGRADGPGRPLLYKTTKEFLRYFGINSLDDLPKLREIEDILKDKDDLPEAVSAEELHLISDITETLAEKESEELKSDESIGGKKNQETAVDSLENAAE